MDSILEFWNNQGQILAFAVLAVGLAIVLGYIIRLNSIKGFKGRYDFINKLEIRVMWNAALVLIIGLALLANTFLAESNPTWFIARIVVSALLGLLIGVIVSNVLKFYYPFFVEKRLKKLRYTPRVSPKSGKPMKLLSEEEEDVYLDEGMQAEENVFSVDYDVWIDEETGYTQIEKYSGHLHALQCPECNYQTFKVEREEIVVSPTVAEEGELMKYFKCNYCGYKSKKAFTIAKLKEAAESTVTA